MSKIQRKELVNSLITGNIGETVPISWEILYDDNGVCIKFSKKLDVYEIDVDGVFYASINNILGFDAMRKTIRKLEFSSSRKDAIDLIKSLNILTNNNIKRKLTSQPADELTNR